MTICVGVLGIAAFAVTQWRARASLRKHDLAVEPMAAFVTKITDYLRALPNDVQYALNLEPQIQSWAHHFAGKENALFWAFYLLKDFNRLEARVEFAVCLCRA